jgi:RNA polymerase sigma-70 factor (ECF subfamily)
MGKWDFLADCNAEVQRALAAKEYTQAFQALLQGYQGVVVQFCQGYVGKEAAEDVAQNVFTAIWQAFLHEQYRATAPLHHWVFRIARNKCIDFVPPAPRPIGDGETNSPPGLNLVVERAQLLSSLQRLTTSERDYLMMHYYSELSFRAMAKILWRPEATVRRAVHKAERRLRELLRQKEQGDEA